MQAALAGPDDSIDATSVRTIPPWSRGLAGSGSCSQCLAPQAAAMASSSWKRASPTSPVESCRGEGNSSDLEGCRSPTDHQQGSRSARDLLREAAQAAGQHPERKQVLSARSSGRRGATVEPARPALARAAGSTRISSDRTTLRATIHWSLASASSGKTCVDAPLPEPSIRRAILRPEGLPLSVKLCQDSLHTRPLSQGGQP